MMSQQQTSFAFTAWIVVICIAFAIGIVQMYGLYRFWKLRGLIIISKRYPNLVVAEAISTIFLCLVTVPFAFNYLLQATDFGLTQYQQKLLYYPGPVLISLSSHLMANLEAIRLWLMSFQLHYLHASRNNEWKSRIDTSHAQNNWYLTHQATFGSPRYLVPRIMVFFVIASCASSVAFIGFGLNYLHFGEAIHLAFLGLPTFLILYAFVASPKEHELKDLLLFHYELRLSAVIYFLQVVVLYPIVMLVYFLGFVRIHVLCMFVMTTIGLVLPSLVSTIWISWKIARLWQGVDTSAGLDALETYVVSKSSQNIDDDDHGKPHVTPQRQLMNLLLDEARFEAFVHWMYREFSSETILSFIELVQFKQRCAKVLSEKHTLEHGDELMIESFACEYNFYENMPKSSIVEKINDARNYGQIASELYEKYVTDGTEFEINIAAQLRSRYADIDRRNWELGDEDFVSLFDDVIGEMFYFLLQSFTRFNTNEID